MPHEEPVGLQEPVEPDEEEPEEEEPDAALEDEIEAVRHPVPGPYGPGLESSHPGASLEYEPVYTGRCELTITRCHMMFTYVQYVFNYVLCLVKCGKN